MNLQMLQFKLNNILKSNAQKRRKLATSGRIEPSRLAHYKTSNLLFSQPIPNTGKEYKCEFLLDVSGSMFGKRLGDAVVSLQNLIRLFYGIIDFKITAFGEGSFNLTPRQVLSLDPDKIYDANYQIQHLKKPTYEMVIGGESHLVTREGEGNYLYVSYGTYGDLAIKKAGEDLLNESGERFIVLLTDGKNNGSSERKYFNYICGTKSIDINEYKNTIKDIKNNGINILPISIDRDYLSDYYDDYIQLSSPEKVYESTIDFIDKHFGELIEY